MYLRAICHPWSFWHGGKRNFGPADLLVIVLIADAAQNALGKDWQLHHRRAGIGPDDRRLGLRSRLEWHERYPSYVRILHAAPLQLVDKGKILDRNLAARDADAEELLEQLREEGVDDVSKVRAAYLEGDGRLSVLKDALNAQATQGTFVFGALVRKSILQACLATGPIGMAEASHGPGGRRAKRARSVQNPSRCSAMMRDDRNAKHP